MTDSAFYRRAQGTAGKMLARFGAAGTLTRIVEGVYDPTTGSASTTGQTWLCTAAVLAYDAKDIDGTLIQAGDSRVLVAPSIETAPQTGDVVAVAGKVLTVVRVSETAPTGIVALYEVQARG